MVVIAFSFLAAVPAANAQVTELWGERYNGGHDDLPWSVAVDSEDNVIVTGQSDDGTTWGYNYYTVKYDKNGVEQWSERYDGSGFDDLAFYVATDSEHNVIVTGWSNDSVDYNYYTVKYGKNGGEIWNRTYDSYSEDMAWFVAADSEDNVIVTGFSHGGASYDYYTIKYDKNGNELWNRTYDGGHNDIAYGGSKTGNVAIDLLAIDSEDNVLVTCSSHNGNYYDYYTIKYDKNGSELWNKTYTSVNDSITSDIVHDSENCVIVTGWSYNGANYDYYTIKYEGPTPTPTAIEVNKTVFNEITSQWVNETTVNVNDTVRFRCEVHNNGTCNLTNITVTDILPDSLEYSGNATVDAAPREPDWIAGNRFEWNFTGSLTPCETITIEFDARVIECGAGKNIVNATAWCEELQYRVMNMDRAAAKVLPGIEVEKNVWDTGMETWVEEIVAEVGDDVTFRTWIHHDGTCCPIFGIVVEDVLPEGLEFVSADPVPDKIVEKGNITTVKWNLVNITLEPCENTSIEMVANVTKGGEHKNEVSANATGCGYEVSDTDEATVSVPPSIAVEKSVWDDAAGEWTYEIEAEIGNEVKFQCIVQNDGSYFPLSNITVEDTLPDSLAFVDADPVPDEVTENEDGTTSLTWNLTGMMLKPGENTTLRINVSAVGCGRGTNWLFGEAKCDKTSLHDIDWATGYGGRWCP